ncbi:class I SAM-dependent methyltransferase [Kutzneria viridogrisea]|uniref:Caffeoyl-CoA O-methyltransferase n=1 Tax=Kutzneria viridogrisea TaxID=47990 RepID=A0ABR6B8U7_9PSEU|nr:caffeoyl-CoA O-methyltransferase [Kutzneria viridogrisea]
MGEFKNIVVNGKIDAYIRGQTAPQLPAQRKLVERTHALGDLAEMQIPHEQGMLLTLLVKILAAELVVEVGTFTGYSALSLALGLAAGGKVITLDRSEEWLDLASEAWQEAGVAELIEFRLGPARESLFALPDSPEIDLAFIDADKVGYIDYWEQLVPRLRAGGLILADNVLYRGEAADDSATGNARAIREFNDHVLADRRVESVLLPVADGLTIARKRTR